MSEAPPSAWWSMVRAEPAALKELAAVVFRPWRKQFSAVLACLTGLDVAEVRERLHRVSEAHGTVTFADHPSPSDPGVFTPRFRAHRDAWEALNANGLLADDWIDNPQRYFHDDIPPQVTRYLGTMIRVTSPGTFSSPEEARSPVPRSVAAALLLASDQAGARRAEALLREAEALLVAAERRLPAREVARWGKYRLEPALGPLRWIVRSPVVSDFGRSSLLVAAARHGFEPARAWLLEDRSDTDPPQPRFEPWEAYLLDGARSRTWPPPFLWRVLALDYELARWWDGEFPEEPNPFARLVEAWGTGYAPCRIFDATLLCGEA